MSTSERSQRERIFGVVVGVVTNTDDPDGLGRVKVMLPWLSDGVESNWARVATPMAGAMHATWFLPCVKDEVLVVFEQGLLERPYVIGALYNGQAKPPLPDGRQQLLRSRTGHMIMLEDDLSKEKAATVAVGTNADDTQKKQAAKQKQAQQTPSRITIFSVAGQLIQLDDKDGKETITVKDKAGSLVVLDSAGITIDSKKDVTVKSANNIALKASANLTIEGKEIKVTASGGFDVNSGALKVK
jgi:uncharacterized protein involved in type VI secretion and phage assembly